MDSGKSIILGGIIGALTFLCVLNFLPEVYVPIFYLSVLVFFLAVTWGYCLAMVWVTAKESEYGFTFAFALLGLIACSGVGRMMASLIKEIAHVKGLV